MTTMHKLRNVKLTTEQLQWLVNIDYGLHMYWQSHKSTPNLYYIENKNLKIQVTIDRTTQEYTIWTWQSD